MARMVKCVKLGREAEGMRYKPFRDELGQRLYDNVSQDDRQRLAYVAKLLREWELIDCDPTLTVDELLGSPLTIVKKADVQQWFIAHKIKF